MNIVLYGGAFNPPTNAHLAIARACLEVARKLDGQLWIMPSGSRPDKQINQCKTKRVSILRAFLRDVDESGEATRLEELELTNTSLTETIDTVRQLEAKYPEHNFHWVFGADSIQTMREWGGGEWLYSHLKMIVIPRAGHELVKLPPNAVLLPVKTLPLSSTMVRARLAARKSVCHLVPKRVGALLDNC